jgi:hypothetical protein
MAKCHQGAYTASISLDFRSYLESLCGKLSSIPKLLLLRFFWRNPMKMKSAVLTALTLGCFSIANPANAQYWIPGLVLDGIRTIQGIDQQNHSQQMDRERLDTHKRQVQGDEARRDRQVFDYQNREVQVLEDNSRSSRERENYRTYGQTHNPEPFDTCVAEKLPTMGARSAYSFCSR